jgi:hypothetical protein
MDGFEYRRREPEKTALYWELRRPIAEFDLKIP